VKTITVLSRKGGSGKTTLAVNLAMMAFLGGHKVLLADMDPQRSASDALRARAEPGPVLAEITAGKLFMTKSNAMREGYDFLFIDTPAAPEADVAQAVNVADFCLVAGRPSFLDLAPIVRSAEAVRRLGKGGLVVLNQAHTNKPEVAPVAFPEIMEALRFCGLPLAPLRPALAGGLPEGDGARPLRVRIRTGQPGRPRPGTALDARRGASGRPGADHDAGRLVRVILLSSLFRP
jgi:chromosome partitioning protein